MPIVYHKRAQTESDSLVKVWRYKQKRCLHKGRQRQKVMKMENEIDRKPGSVLNDDLSRPAIADRLMPPSGHASSAVRPI